MTGQQLGKVNKLAIILAIIAPVLAIIAVTIKYIRFGQVDVGVLVGGVAISVAVIFVAMSSRKGNMK